MAGFLKTITTQVKLQALESLKHLVYLKQHISTKMNQHQKISAIKTLLPSLLLLLISLSTYAQFPEDALRLSWLTQSGTARNQAIGGAAGSLGGDITSTFVNPAGLGFYKTNELVLSPGFSYLNSKGEYRGTNASDKNGSFNLGTTGIVLGFQGQQPRKTSALSIAVNRTANLNSRVFYKGTNDYSSFSEQFAEELANSGIDIGTPNLELTSLSLGTKMAIYNFLIDTATINGNTQVVGLPEFLASRNQEASIRTIGGVTEIALGIASNSNDKFYIGGTLGLPIVNYERRTFFRESDPTTVQNDFDYATFDEMTTVKGVGVNAKVGMIFKPVESLRIGLAVHTPTLYGLRDTYTSTMTAATEGYNGISTVSSEIFTGDAPAQYDYNLVTPWKFLMSGSYIFGEIEDVTKQKGFLTADVEYISYKGNSFQSAESNNDASYYSGINSTIDQIYKGSFNVKVGGELKFQTFMARAGYAHYGNPYADAELNASRSLISGGVGYRDKGIFLDLTFVYAMQSDVNFPYRLGDKANTFANLKSNGVNAVVTAGFKF